MSAPRCIWCFAPIAELELPPPAAFCSVDCHAHYRFACAELGQDMHRAGAVDTATLHRDFRERWNRYNPAFLINPHTRRWKRTALIILIAGIVVIAHSILLRAIGQY